MVTFAVTVVAVAMVLLGIGALVLWMAVTGLFGHTPVDLDE